MGMNLGGSSHGRPKPSMNVTPLVDVVLVLLIIFMVITPMMVKQVSVNVPVKDDKKAKLDEPSDNKDAEPQVVLRVRSDGNAYLNKRHIPDGALAMKLKRVFAARSDQTLFFDADDGLPFGRAMEVLDLARGIGLKTIAVLPDRLED
jgi:biopolymer transport protein ExbD